MDRLTSGALGASPKPYLSPKARARALWLTVHRWLGIVLLVPMAILGVTGSAQVWPEETEALLYPQREVAASADPSAITAEHVAAARAALAPWGDLVSIEAGEDGTPLTATSTAYAPPLHGMRGDVSRIAYVDPDSAQALDTAASSGSFMWYMHLLHGVLLIPDIGRAVVGWMGVFLTVSAVTGLYVFWPGFARFRVALRWQKRDGFNLNLHRQSGVILSIVIVVEAITGAWISFPTFFASVVEPGVEQPERRRPGGGGPGGEPLFVDDAGWIVALDRAQAAWPGRVQSIAAPVGEDGAWQVQILGQGMEGKLSLPVSGGAPEIEESPVRTGPPPPATRAQGIAGVMRQLHYALIGGFVWEVLVFLSGIALTFLSISGVYVWLKRTLRRRRKTALTRLGAAA